MCQVAIEWVRLGKSTRHEDITYTLNVSDISHKGLEPNIVLVKMDNTRYAHKKLNAKV